MITLKKADITQAEECYSIIDQGRKFQRRQGFVQWGDNYPSLETIKNDILSGNGYVLLYDENIAGYTYIGFDGEPAYATIDGRWHSAEKYAVIHRVAISDNYRGKGISTSFFDLVAVYCKNNGVFCLRINTDFANKRMQHVLEKNGFSRCGIITIRGSEKVAFDKIL